MYGADIYLLLPADLATYSLCPKLLVILDFRVISLTRFIECATFVFSNNFIMKINSAIYLMILIIYYKH
jgi:hypothetical protein